MRFLPNTGSGFQTVDYVMTTGFDVGDWGLIKLACFIPRGGVGEGG